MGKGIAYWSGTKQAVLTDSLIDASNIKDHKTSRIALPITNNAFKYFFNARKIISGASDAKTKLAMTADLEDAGRTGWGMRGVHDLEEAFDHLAVNNGRWKDTTTSTYGWHSAGKIGGTAGGAGGAGIGYVMVPYSIECFLDALDARKKTLNKHLANLKVHSSAVVSKVVSSTGDQVLPKVGTPEWSAFSTGLGRVNTAHDGIKKVLWLASVSEHSIMQTSSGKLDKVLGAIGKVRSAVENIDVAKKAGMSDTESAAYAAIVEGLGYLPVLGSYYQEAFKLIPGVKVGFEQIVGQKNALCAKLGIEPVYLR